MVINSTNIKETTTTARLKSLNTKKKKWQIDPYVMVCINSSNIYHLSLKSLNTKREKASGPLCHGFQQAHTCGDVKLADKIPVFPSLLLFSRHFLDKIPNGFFAYFFVLR
jgi:hypothetical protein